MNDDSQFYHQPVLLEEVISFLVTRPDGIYLDGTLGGGGHAENILKILDKKARYLGLDQDTEALETSRIRLKTFSNISFHHTNFADFDRILTEQGITLLDGIFLDLGLSSRQIDSTARGFSYMQDTDLDMRMNREDPQTAADLLNNLDEKSLSDVFYHFGEERKSRQIAREILNYRKKQAILTSGQLTGIIDRVIPGRFAIKSYARIFQALRISVNRELTVLQEVLARSIPYLNTGGRCVVISYHSLEDRIVKSFFREKANPCTCPHEFPQCICGKVPEMKILTSKAVKASDREIRENSRSRSARLRVGEKL